MQPHTQPRKKRNSSRVNLLISLVFHSVLVVALFYFAARQGLLGEKLKKISVEMVKEKPPEKPKEPEKPKVEPPKEVPKIAPPMVAEAPRVSTAPEAPPTVAPPAADVPSFEFSGGKTVETSSDPIQLYRGYMEYALRQRWNRPDNDADDTYVAEVNVAVDKSGEISQPNWLKGSGDRKWDDSVKEVFKVVKNIGRPPPTNFPSRVTIRFDVQEQTEPVLQ